MLLRPHTMPGGYLHEPLWKPYALYGEVDHMYGFKQWNLNNPFAATQSWLNLVENVLYLVYLGLWYVNGRALAPGARRAVGGKVGALAVLVGFSAAVMTVSKTVLYCKWDGLVTVCVRGWLGIGKLTVAQGCWRSSRVLTTLGRTTCSGSCSSGSFPSKTRISQHTFQR